MTDPEPLFLNTKSDPPFKQIELRKGITEFTYPDRVKLVVDNHGDNNITVTLKTPKGVTIETVKHTLSSDSPFLVGKSKKRNDTIVVPEQYARVSSAQADIRLEDGRIVYEHLGSNRIFNPYAPGSISETKVLTHPAALAGGYIDENKVAGNYRASNEDRGGVFPAPALTFFEARRLIKEIFRKVQEAVKGCPPDCGSTLSIAIPTDDEEYLCGFIGDSPFYLVGRDKETGRVILPQVGLPHTWDDQFAGAWWDVAEFITTYNTKTIWEQAREQYQLQNPGENLEDSFEDQNPIASNIHADELWIADLEQAPQCARLNDKLPEIFMVNPKIDFFGEPMPERIEFLGMMVCSDGMANGIANKEVQAAIQEKLAPGVPPSAAEIAQVAVEAATLYTTDNVTATFIPVGCRDVAAVADGNLGSDIIADKAMTAVSSHMASIVLPEKSAFLRPPGGISPS